jgi:hypothetical protein
MGKSKNKWAAASEWQQILVVTPTGVECLKPDTLIYLTDKKRTILITVKDILEDLFQMAVNAGHPSPWDNAVKCISEMAVVKKMNVHDPVTGRLMCTASLTPPRSMMH